MSAEYQNFFATVGGNEGQKCHYPTRLDTYGCGLVTMGSDPHSHQGDPGIERENLK